MKRLLPMVLGTLLFAATPLQADDAALADRLGQLESETQALRTELQWLREHPVRLPQVEAAPVSMSAPADNGRRHVHLRPGSGDDDLHGQEVRLDEGRFHRHALRLPLGQHGLRDRTLQRRRHHAVRLFARNPRRRGVPPERPGDSAGHRRGRSAAAVLQLRPQRRQGRVRLLRLRSSPRTRAAFSCATPTGKSRTTISAS